MTAQAHEDLIYDRKHLSMISFPDLPEAHPRIREVDLKGLDMDDPKNEIVHSSACWRQYIGTWQIKENHLYLKTIRGIYQIVGVEPIFADWFTGELVIPQGKMTQYHHAGWLSEYERYLRIQVEKGIVVGERTVEGGQPII